MDISVITFDPASAEIKKLSRIDELPSLENKKIMWININSAKSTDHLVQLSALYKIHPLTIEDVLNTKQQPKVETFDNYSYISFKSIQQEESFHGQEDRPKKKYGPVRRKRKNPPGKLIEFHIDQIGIIIMKNILITFQEIPGDPFDGIRKHILENAGQIRKKDTDYLAYSLIDAVVDSYFLILAHLEQDIENFEDRAVKTNDDKFITEIQDTKKYLLQIKQAMLPLRDNILSIARRNIIFINDELKPFLQDLEENLNNAINTIENYRDWLSNIMQVNLSVLSFQMNKVMKILAIVSSIFIPLTFIAGIYGMNFDFMPELNQPWGYPVVLGGMGIIAVIMIIFFKLRRWF